MITITIIIIMTQTLKWSADFAEIYLNDSVSFSLTVLYDL